MRLVLIRHAESEANTRLDVVGGQVNETPLTQKGIGQAELLGKRLLKQQIQFKEVHSSIAVRAAHTARLACQTAGFDLNKIQYTDTLVEISQGVWTGMPRTEVYTPETLGIISQNPWEFKPPQGESQRDVEERAWGYLEQNIFSRTWQPEDRVAVFAHGIVIKCIIKRMLSSEPAMTWRINIENTSLTTFHLRENGWFIDSINDFGHLLFE